jgi:hypothetical protein
MNTRQTSKFSIVLATALLAVLAGSSTVHAQIVLAGWYDFTETGNHELSTGGAAPDVSATGVTGDLWGGDGDRTTNGSTDGFFGNSSFATGTGATINGAMTIRDVGNATAADPEAGDQILVLTITNNGINDITLDNFYFDIEIFDDANDPVDFNYASGDLTGVTNGTLIGTTIDFADNGSASSDYFDVGFSLGSLADQTLSTGQSATFHLVNPNPASEAGGATRLDNLAFTGTVVPEPGTFALLAVGLGGLFLLRRRTSQ